MHYKHAVMDYCLIPRYAFLDPGLSCSLPPDMTAYSGMDALTHAVEAYCNRFCSPKMKAHAKKAVRLIGANLLTAYREPENKEARMNMLAGSYEAGIAFTNAYVGYVHAIAHGIGGLYHVPHGEANAILLPKVLAAYGSAVYTPLARLEREVRTSVAEDESREETDAVLAEAFIERIRRMNRSMASRRSLPCCVRRTCRNLRRRHSKRAIRTTRSRDLGGGTDESIPDGTGTKVTVRRAFRKNIAQNGRRIFCNLTVYIMYAKKYMRFSCNSIQIIYNV